MRNDAHAPSNFDPASYIFAFYFNLCTAFEGEEVPSFNIDRIVTLREEGHTVSPIHPTNQCDVCGTCFVWGECWLHEPTGEYITIGHQCAEKYRLYADGFEQYKGRQIAKAERRAKQERYYVMLEEYELEDVQDGDHYIVEDILSKLRQYGSLSEKQIALVNKIRQEEAQRAHDRKVREAQDAATNWIDAPAGRDSFEGTVLATKSVENQYGSTLKMLVKVDTDSGSFKLWGTVPDSIKWVESADWPGRTSFESPKGKTISFTATVEPKETGFAFFKRPAKAIVVEA